MTQENAEFHPLHTYLDPLLLSLKDASSKYHNTLTEILNDGGGEGESEERMMWFAWNHETINLDDQNDTEESWRKQWLKKLEQKECDLFSS